MALAAPTSAASISVLVLDGYDVPPRSTAVLSGTYRVITASSATMAREFLTRWRPELVVTELQLQDGQGIEVCRAVKAMTSPPLLLVMTADVTQVPDALDAGCDAVLLKPFAPNLLMFRVSRLLRERSNQRQFQRSTLGRSMFAARSPLDTIGDFPHLTCPFCAHQGVTSFDHSSMRRDWFACLKCRKVWLAKRQEH